MSGSNFGKIACIGGATLDRRVEPLERLRAGTSNPVRTAKSTGGTARNVAEALARLGCSVSLFSRVGRDAAGDRVLAELGPLGVALKGVDRYPDAPTASYSAVLDENGELALGLADMEIFDSLDESWLRPLKGDLLQHDLWIVDANLPPEVLASLARLLPPRGRIFADPVSVAKSRRLGPILDRIETVFPDRAEALELAGGQDGLTDCRSVAGRLLERGVGSVVITLGADGVWVEAPPRHEKVPAMTPAATLSVNGAGDCLLAGYVFARNVSAAIDPIRCGLAAATMAIESPTAVPRALTAESLLDRYQASR